MRRHGKEQDNQMGYKELKFDKDSIFLVTGGAGFIGSNLCEAITDMGCQVRCLDDLSTGREENVKMFADRPNYTFIKGDIKDLDTCMKACEGATYVLHQAAWGSVPRSIEMPLFYEQNNIMGTLNMMEAARQNGVKKFVYASSSSVYGDHPVLPKKEAICYRRMRSQNAPMRSMESSIKSFTVLTPMECAISTYSDAGRIQMALTRRLFRSLSNSFLTEKCRP